jgi:hypothetical protein
MMSRLASGHFLFADVLKAFPVLSGTGALGPIEAYLKQYQINFY